MDRVTGAEGAKAGRKNERLCAREERKRRKTALAGEEGPHVQRPVDPNALLAAQDDRSSAASGLDVVDRLTYLEQRMQMQEDEIQLLKMALADVLKRLNITEELQANAARRPGTKARPVSLALSSRPGMKKSSTAPSAGPARNYSPTPSSSSVRSSSSVKDSPKAHPGSAAFSRKPQESSKPKEAAVTLGTRRVTHCKVTMQIYLSPLAKKTGCSEAAKSSATVTARGKPTTAAAAAAATTNRPGTKTGKAEKKKDKFTLNLQKTSSSSSQSHQETSSYHSPVKSPSQYFQICY